MIVTVIIVVDVISVLIAVTIFFFWYLMKVCWCVYWNYELNSRCPVIHERKKKNSVLFDFGSGKRIGLRKICFVTLCA